MGITTTTNSAATYTPIATTTITSATTSVVFNSIPQTYTDLRVVVQGVAAGSNTSTYLRFNGDTTSSYSGVYLYQNGAGSALFGSMSVVFMGGLFDTQSMSIADVFNYSTSGVYKPTISKWNHPNSQVLYDVCTWRKPDAITQITVLADAQMAVGTNISIYGIKAA